MGLVGSVVSGVVYALSQSQLGESCGGDSSANVLGFERDPLMNRHARNCWPQGA